MSSAKTQPARGMRDFLPADVRKREYVIGVIKEVYERYGFEPLETPAVENIETLMGKYGEEGNQLIFKILKRGLPPRMEDADVSELTDLALRYDLTVPLARVVAEYRDSKLPKFFKRYQIQPVWRADRPARGRFREFYQCDVDVLDSHSMLVEAELCSAVSDVLIKLGFSDFIIRLNHIQVLAGILKSEGIPIEKHNATLVALDKFDKLGEKGVKVELGKLDLTTTQIHNILDATYADKVSAILAADGEHGLDLAFHNKKLLSNLKQRIGSYEQSLSAINDLATILEFTEMTSAGSHMRIDTGLARGLSYYTGPIMEIAVEGLSGSVGGGGRYDKLIGMFLKDDVPACGFSLGLERIIVVMSDREMFTSGLVKSAADVMVTIWGKERKWAKQSLQLAQELRRDGLRVDIYPVRDVKIGAQLRYAAKRNFPFVMIIGEDEAAKNEVRLKDMRFGSEELVSWQLISRRVKEQLGK
jgi:histidyl-tRNA synthetase